MSSVDVHPALQPPSLPNARRRAGSRAADETGPTGRVLITRAVNLRLTPSREIRMIGDCSPSSSRFFRLPTSNTRHPFLNIAKHGKLEKVMPVAVMISRVCGRMRRGQTFSSSPEQARAL